MRSFPSILLRCAVVEDSPVHRRSAVSPTHWRGPMSLSADASGAFSVAHSSSTRSRSPSDANFRAPPPPAVTHTSAVMTRSCYSKKHAHEEKVNRFFFFKEQTLNWSKWVRKTNNPSSPKLGTSLPYTLENKHWAPVNHETNQLIMSL